MMIAEIGWILLATSAIGTLVSCALEIKGHEPIYMVLLKVFAFLTALSGVLIGIGVGGI